MIVVFGYKDGVVQEIFKDFAVFGFFFFGLFFGFGFGVSIVRFFFFIIYFGFGIFRYFFNINGVIGIFFDGDFVCLEERSLMRVEMKVKLYKFERKNNSRQYF